MNINLKKIGTLVLFMVSIFILSGCEFLTSQATITSIEVEATTLEDSYDIDTFELSSISIKVLFSDGKFQSIPITEAMLSNEHLALLASVGEHEIIITYEGKTTSVTLKLVNNEVKAQLMAIYTLATTEGGFTGTYEEWLAGIQGEDGLDIKSALINNEGHLILTLSDDSTIDAGKVVPEDAKEVEFQTSETHIQWRYVGDETWGDLITLESLKGLKGDTGVDGKEVEFQVAEGFIQWKYSGEANWTNLISLVILTGEQGEEGKSAYEIYKENNPTYTKSESEWIEDLVNGRLATIEETKYTVTFNSDGGTLVASQEVVENKKATEPAIPTKEGYTFVGWFIGEEKWSFIGYSITEDIVIYAKWTINQYTIVFDSNGGSSVGAIIQDYATLVIEPIQPIKEGYTFNGWYSDTALTKSYSFTNMPAESITLYAKWTINQYTIAFDSNGGSSVNTITQDYATTVVKPVDPTREGYTFNGWYIDSDYTMPFEFTNMPAENLMLYAKWDINNYDITYHLNDGINDFNPTTYSIETSTINLIEPIKAGYTFNGWYDNVEYTGTSISEITQGTIGDITLYAKWIINQYTIAFDSNGGSSVNAITQDYATIVVDPAEPTREGYIFYRWYSDTSLTTQYTFTTMPAENLTLYAKWEMITYSITYVMNEYTTNDASNPATYNVTSNISLIAPSVIGGTFIGWFTDEDYTNEIKNISNMTGNITLYAKVEMNQYTMTFVTNGGTEISPITQDYDTAIHVSTTKEEFIFVAWCSDEGLTTSIDISKMPNANLTVYAKWAQMYAIDNMTYVYYGTYPQTVVSDSALISSLNTLTSTNANGYFEYEGEEYSKVVAQPNESGYKFINGSTIQSGQTYYFKVEPIKWRLLEEADGTYTLLSEYIIDKQVFYTSTSKRTIGGQTIYANNYEHSTIREWLNNAFYNKAFSTQEKGSILTTLVDNSASTTSSSPNPYFSNNTMDKVYLLSYQEATSSTYGFSSSTSSSSARTAVTTDYARAVGAYMNTSTSYYGNGYWWLRRPSSSISSGAHSVDDDGSIYGNSVFYSNYGARPAIKIG